VSERLPRPVRLLLGATSPGVSDARLRGAVSGRIVLITGASSGVGRASALRLARGGATVLLVARREELLAEVADEIAAAGGPPAGVYPCDLADGEQVDALAAAVLADRGAIDVVVSNAGLSIRRWVSESYARPHDFERTINVNYLGPVRLLLGLLPAMRRRGSGQIVNVATMGVDFPAMRWSAYIASKTAFETWLGGVAPEIRADGIATTSIHLQLVRSPMLGPFEMWKRVPGMSTEEAAGIVARAIVERPRVISPLWARLGGPLTQLAQRPVELAMSRNAARHNADTQHSAPGPSALAVAGEVIGGLTSIAASRTVRPIRPDKLARLLQAQRRYGVSPGFALAMAAELHPERSAVIDEQDAVSFRDLDAEARALAGALHHHFELGAGNRVAILCRNHRGFVLASAGAARLGCDLVPLNTDFAGPQLADVLRREQVVAAIYDEEFEPLFDAADFEGTRILAWHEGAPARATLNALVDLGAAAAPAPSASGHTVMMTSGTTGTPKGATRTISPLALPTMAVAGLLDLSRIKPTPRSGDPIVVAPPLFHLYGQIGLMAGALLGSPIVIRRRFDPEAVLAQIERERAGVLLAVPTMLKRIIDLPAEPRDRYDTTSLRMVTSGAAPLPPELATAVMDRFGPVLYNGYASTEVGAVTLATPADLRAAPGTIGKPVAGVSVKLLDDEGVEVPRGATGRIFVGSPMLFDGYTGGGGKEVIDGRMSSGDVGHFDRRGRLFIDGRDDDMILSGGENVFPQEVEDLLLAHPAVADAAVFGVPDPEFGQRLAAAVVLKPGASATEDALRAHVRERLARFKVPREMAFVDALPRTSTGKLQRRKLGTPAPDPSARPRR
jgi:acyl-CoA synthetase (AMP-forming)/AMP-acid ligase II/NAD(P)-dependent dehydrogenase (short-subunit alcohol dehydrogenase family)